MNVSKPPNWFKILCIPIQQESQLTSLKNRGGCLIKFNSFISALILLTKFNAIIVPHHCFQPIKGFVLEHLGLNMFIYRNKNHLKEYANWMKNNGDIFLTPFYIKRDCPSLLRLCLSST